MPKPNRVVEKPKDFKNSIKRLIKNLKPWSIIIIISLILAIISSILALIMPNKLSDLTDVITDGIKPDTSHMAEISEKIFSNISKDEIEEKSFYILTTSKFSNKDKEDFKKVLEELNTTENPLITFSKLPDKVLIYMFEDIEVDGQIISKQDQVSFIKLANNKDVENLEELPDSIFNIFKPTIKMNKVKKLSKFIATIILISSLFLYIQNFIMSTVSNRFAQKLRKEISKKINKLPLRFFDDHENGDILSRITNDVDTTSQNLNNSLSSFVSAITLFIGSIIMMFYTNWVMAITAILASIFGFGFMVIILSKSQKYFKERQENLGNLNAYIEEMYSSHDVIKSYNGEKKAIKEFSELNTKLFEANRKSQFLSGLMQPMMMFIGNFGYVAVCVVGALLVTKGHITFGVIIAFIMYVRLFSNQLTQIAQVTSSFQLVAASAERIFEFMDETELEKEKNNLKVLDKSKVKGKIEFKKVKFGYNKNKTIIKNFTATVKPGQKVAIVGPTGAGKTTLVNLLMRFYEINEGKILIDGIDIKDLSRENIHDLFCMVLQNTWLFEGTIRDNIIYNSKDKTEKDLEKVCDIVGLSHFIKTLPQGFDYNIKSDNDTISTGQKQLFTIARGMLKDSPLLILDEATSNVDTRTEELVQKAMDKLTKGKTSFIIAHRLSTIKNADLILVIKDGNIIEKGTHNTLIKKNGFYKELYNAQFTKNVK